MTIKIHDLRPNRGAKKKKIRRGRGDASGYGSFSGRGCKGQNARSGGGVRNGFEGGQTPLVRQMPKKKGFKSLNKTEYTVVNLSFLEEAFEENEVVSPETLLNKKIIRKKNLPVKILGDGVLKKKLSFENVIFSKAVQKKLGTTL
jgi:large subunit ribosomal protein L15